jgi:type IV pilus assembly protein PilE
MDDRPLQRPQLGFTLIELLLAVVILAVLAAVAYPSFIDAIRKSRRAEAMTALSAIQLAQERYRNNQPTYASDLADLGQPSSTESGYYGLSVSGSATGYTAVAVPASGSSQVNDGDCAQLSVQMDGGNLSYGSAAASGTLVYPDTNRCWAR